MNKELQKALIEEYMEIIKTEVWEGSPRMQEFARKECAYVVKLESGDIFDIDKPRIKKDFCFGHGMYGWSTNEQEERANNAAENARTNVDYFLERNLRGLNSTIDDLRDETKKAYSYIHYTGQPETSKLKTFSVCSLAFSPEWEPNRWSNLKALQELTMAEREEIAKGYEEVRKKFMKRLETYLKKYGLSKLNVWTYLVD